MKISKKQEIEGGQFFVIAHNIRSIHNVGSVFRNADAFGVDKIFLTGYTGTPDHPKIHKVALGAELVVPWEKRRSLGWLLKKLRQDIPKIKIIGLENNINYPVTQLANFSPKFPLALVLGEETKGMTKSIITQMDELIEIPMQGIKESLNVSVACGIALFEIDKKKKFYALNLP
ncbi:MAG: TrmH family RNA methyltransferase [Candidatus Doudnabacteria bacterium]